MDAWWRGLDRARKLMLAGAGLMFLSQFLNYVGRHTEERSFMMLGVFTPTASGGRATVKQVVGGTWGWGLHPHAILLIGAVAVVFAMNLDLGPAWRRWRYWAGVAALVLCLLPFNLGAPGLGLLLGLVAVGLGVWAARLHAAAASVAPGQIGGPTA